MNGEALAQVKSRLVGLGQGTWYMGDVQARRAEEIRALRTGVDLGMTVIDTAEMYGDGRSEALVGEAIAGIRSRVFIIDKVLPFHAARSGVAASCEQSLRLLKTDRIDLYLLHWRGDIPFGETVAGMEDLLQAGKICAWGVSNLDEADLQELYRLPNSQACAADEILYNLSRRGVEHRLLPWCGERGLPVIAYSPIEQGRILSHPGLAKIAAGRGATPAQIALAWVISHPGLMAIPKAATTAHVRENAMALDMVLDREELAGLDQAFPLPGKDVGLEVL